MISREVLQVVSLLFLVLLFTGFSSDQPDKPCAECHSDLLEGTSRHQPVVQGDCVVCHESSGKLTLPGEELCFTCHSDIAPKGKTSPHNFFIQGQCQVCHTQHASNEPHLLITGPITVCESCHPDQRGGRSHPVGKNILDPRTEGALTCTSTCHDPHSSEQPFLLRRFEGRELCWSCHQDKF